MVGLDNWEEGWTRDHRQACDLAYQTLNLLGFRFNVVNPEASLFAPNSLVTVPYAPLGTSDVTQIPGVEFPLQKPTGAIFSVGLDGGDLKVEALGASTIPRGWHRRFRIDLPDRPRDGIARNQAGRQRSRCAFIN